MERVNVFSVATELDPGDPPGYHAPRAKLGPMIGARMLGGSIYELQPGQSVCPYHYEYGNEEWLLVLEGSVTLRHPEGAGDRESALEPGDLVCFPECFVPGYRALGAPVPPADAGWLEAAHAQVAVAAGARFHGAEAAPRGATARSGFG